jgi:hypothetical protein
MPAATSQLVIDRPFVLRHLNRGFGPEVLQKTLKSDQLRRQNEQLQRELAAGGSGGAGGGADAVLLEAARKVNQLEAKLAGTGGAVGGVAFGLNPKQQKAAQAELRALKEAHGAPLLELKDALAESETLRSPTGSPSSWARSSRTAGSTS